MHLPKPIQPACYGSRQPSQKAQLHSKSEPPKTPINQLWTLIALCAVVERELRVPLPGGVLESAATPQCPEGLRPPNVRTVPNATPNAQNHMWLTRQTRALEIVR
jgi:hypothetical protein